LEWEQEISYIKLEAFIINENNDILLGSPTVKFRNRTPNCLRPSLPPLSGNSVITYIA
jgi:hypothetical protein